MGVKKYSVQGVGGGSEGGGYSGWPPIKKIWGNKTKTKTLFRGKAGGGLKKW